MSFHFTADNLDDIHECLVQELLENPDCESAPRGQPIKELLGASFTLMNPRARLIASPTRAVNYGFAVGEFCWYARGADDLETMAFYNKRMPSFSDDGLTLNSAYGKRMFDDVRGAYLRSQWDSVLEELKRDPCSRRAIMVINEPRDLLRAVDLGSKDVPCTMALQLLIRDKKLNLSVTMRSNDIWWGLPYDVFSFTMLQESFVLELAKNGVEVDDVGSYHHYAGSLHLYDRHFGDAAKVVEEIPQRLRAHPMAPFTLDGMVNLVDELEPSIRAGNGPNSTYYLENPTEKWMVEQLVAHAEKRNKEKK